MYLFFSILLRRATHASFAQRFRYDKPHDQGIYEMDGSGHVKDGYRLLCKADYQAANGWSYSHSNEYQSKRE
jgi:hypothetical protein